MFAFIYRKISALTVLLLVSITLSACNGSQGSSEANEAQQANSDQEIIEAVYLDQRTPAGFYQENLPKDAFYSISNVKNVELLPITERAGENAYELSAADFYEALDWSERAATQKPVYMQLVENSETELYYQFKRVSLDNPDFIHLSRVFKKTALDRSGVDITQPGSYLGKILLQNQPADKIKMIIEYLWIFTYSNNYGTAILESYINETDSEFIHTMEEAKLISGQAGVCDTIEILTNTYVIQKDTGSILRYQDKIREIYSKREGNEFVLCSDIA